MLGAPRGRPVRARRPARHASSLATSRSGRPCLANDYDVRIAHARGEHVWHVHEHTDEFFLVLDGTFDVSLREDGRERTARLRAGDIFVVPRGTEHKPSSDGGAILMFEPSGTLTTGDRHEGDIPAYVDSTAGHDLAGRPTAAN